MKKSKRVTDVCKLSVRTEFLTMGIDLGDRHSHTCLVERDGGIRERSRFPTTRNGLEKFLFGRSTMRIVIECGTHSPWVSRLLREHGHEVIVANPRKVRLISHNDKKSDKLDPELLARLGRIDPNLLAPIQHRGAKVQVDLARLRARTALVRARTKLINHVRGAIKSIGGRVRACSAPGFPKRAAQDMPQEIRPALAPLLETILSISQKIRSLDREIEHIARDSYSETTLLRQVNGVGILTAMTYVLTIEDPRRFDDSRKVGSYVGLRPKQSDSGNVEPELRITKAGDTVLRALLVQSAQYILGPFGTDSDLRRWGLRLADRGGKKAKRRVVVAVARKLSVLLHSLWVNTAVYKPLRQEKAA